MGQLGQEIRDKSGSNPSSAETGEKNLPQNRRTQGQQKLRLSWVRRAGALAELAHMWQNCQVSEDRGKKAHKTDWKAQWLQGAGLQALC